MFDECQQEPQLLKITSLHMYKRSYARSRIETCVFQQQPKTQTRLYIVKLRWHSHALIILKQDNDYVVS